MRYYTIQNNSILIAESRKALERFYNNVLELPIDYGEGKYIVDNDELVLNPNWEEEQKQKKRERKRQEILDELDKLDLKSIRAIRAKDEEYIAQYEAQAQELRKQLQEL